MATCSFPNLCYISSNHIIDNSEKDIKWWTKFYKMNISLSFQHIWTYLESFYSANIWLSEMNFSSVTCLVQGSEKDNKGQRKGSVLGFSCQKWWHHRWVSTYECMTKWGGWGGIRERKLTGTLCLFLVYIHRHVYFEIQKILPYVTGHINRLRNPG